MPALRISKRADPAFVEAFRSLLGRLVRSAGISARHPVTMYLAGGAAVHFYVGSRSTDDIDAVFSQRLLLPADSAVIFRDAEGNARSVHFDPNYSESHALMHEDAHEDAWPLELEGLEAIRVMVLQPVDLAISKLARFGEIDRSDIRELARAGLFTAQELRARAEEALHGYVGDPASLKTSIDLACRGLEARKPKRSRRGRGR